MITDLIIVSIQLDLRTVHVSHDPNYHAASRAIVRRQKAVCLIKRMKSEFTNITFSASSRVNPSV